MLKTEADISEKFKQYEEAKRELPKNLSPQEYEAEIKRIIEELEI